MMYTVCSRGMSCNFLLASPHYVSVHTDCDAGSLALAQACVPGAILIQFCL